MLLIEVTDKANMWEIHIICFHNCKPVKEME